MDVRLSPRRKLNKVIYSCLAVTLLSSCQAKGNSNVNVNSKEFDKRFQQAVQGMMQLQQQRLVAAQPCMIIGGERDYRYHYCFAERAGAAVSTMRQVHDLFLKAGFKGEIDPDGLSGTFTLPAGPYRVQSSFGSGGIEWQVFEEGRGFVAPDAKRDGSDAPYALMSPQEFVRLQALQYAMFATPKGEALPNSASCGISTATEASICFSQPVKNPLQPFVKVYFAGEQSTFDTLNKKATFKYDESDLIAEMIKQGVLNKGSKSSKLFNKTKAHVYQLTDTFDHPAYQLTFDLTAPGGTGVKITAKRIPISAKVKSERERP